MQLLSADNGGYRPVTLYQSLIEAGWQPQDFDDAGPYPPYTRVATRLSFDGLAPCFMSHARRWPLKRARKFEVHFAPFSFIKVSSKACEDAFGQGWLAATSFPAGRWLRMTRFTLTRRFVVDYDAGGFHLPLPLLPMAGQIELV